MYVIFLVERTAEMKSAAAQGGTERTLLLFIPEFKKDNRQCWND